VAAVRFDRAAHLNMKSNKSNFVKSIAGVAGALGVTPTAVNGWLRGGCPGKTAKGYDVGAIRKWREANLNPSNNAKHAGSLHDAKLAKTLVETRILELEEKKTRGDLITMADAQGMIRAALMPFRDALIGVGDSLAERVNPGDPEHARKELEAWKDRTMTMIRRAMDKTEGPQ